MIASPCKLQIHTTEDSLVLQRDLNTIMKWSEDWQMFLILVSVYTSRLQTGY